MAVRLSDRFLEQLRDRIDIEDLIGEYVDLKRAGRLSKGLCPFHNEKTPSFVVYEDTRSFYSAAERAEMPLPSSATLKTSSILRRLSSLPTGRDSTCPTRSMTTR